MVWTNAIIEDQKPKLCQTAVLGLTTHTLVLIDSLRKYSYAQVYLGTEPSGLVVWLLLQSITGRR